MDYKVEVEAHKPFLLNLLSGHGVSSQQQKPTAGHQRTPLQAHLFHFWSIVTRPGMREHVLSAVYTPLHRHRIPQHKSLKHTPSPCAAILPKSLAGPPHQDLRLSLNYSTR